MADLTPLESTTGDGALIEDLTRRAEQAKPPQPYPLERDTAVIARVLRSDETLKTFSLERFLEAPVRPRGGATLYDPGDFCAYVKRLGDGWSTVWGDEDSARFTAVFNDHYAPDSGGWRDHTATLALKTDPDWKEFLSRDGTLSDQFAFAEFLQDYQSTFLDPSGASLLELATQFKASRRAEFDSAVDLDTGDTQLTYNVTTKQVSRSGQIEMPKEVTVALSPFLGMPPVQMLARLRWDIDNGHLRIGFKLQRPDLVRRDALADIRQVIVDALAQDPDGGVIKVLLGSPPRSVEPTV